MVGDAVKEKNSERHYVIKKIFPSSKEVEVVPICLSRMAVVNIYNVQIVSSTDIEPSEKRAKNIVLISNLTLQRITKRR